MEMTGVFHIWFLSSILDILENILNFILAGMVAYTFNHST